LLLKKQKIKNNAYIFLKLMLCYYKLLKIYFIHGPKIFFFISFKTTTTTAVTTHTHTQKNKMK